MKVCLTFDAEHPDQPHNLPPSTGLRQILWALDKEEVPAMFFIQGKWARAYPLAAKEIVLRGHQIGSHGYSHEVAAMQSASGFISDLSHAENAIAEATGANPKPWYRYPYGAEAYADDLNRFGWQGVGWNVDSEDYRPANAGTGAVWRNVMMTDTFVAENNIILFHTWPSGTASDLPDILKMLKDAGAEFGTLG